MDIPPESITNYAELLRNISIMNVNDDSESPAAPAKTTATAAVWLASLPTHDERTRDREPKVRGTQIALPGQPPLFAFIIGIDNYQDDRLTKLYGAVSDAEAMRKYLVEDLKVPDSQVTLLYNRDASRQAIIDGFIKLRDNKNIKKDDPILIYYAGHGGELEQEGSDPIQTIFPQDYSRGRVRPIPDRTIGNLLNSISRKHGNNIVVIFDCCHSGSGTRGDEDPYSRVRGAPVSIEDLPPDLDNNINGGTRGVKFANGFAQSNMRSHVLLAACSANEKAREDAKDGNGHGRFTTAFLRLLRAVGADQLAYADVLNRMDPITGQNPQCEGFYKDRVFFDAKAPSPGRFCYEVKFENNKYILQAGSAHGITTGAQFTIYESKEAVLVKESLGVMTTQTITAFTTVLEPADGHTRPRDFKNGETPVGLQTKVGVAEDFLLHVPIQPSCLPIFKAIIDEMNGDGPNPCRITLVDRDKAQLEMLIGEGPNGKVIFNILDPRLRKYGITTVPYTLERDVDPDKLRAVLRAAAHYTFHLNHTYDNTRIRDNITFEFLRVWESENEFDDDGYATIIPDTKNLIRGGMLDIVVEKGVMYGIKIKNDTPWNLHFQCLYFDNDDFSIKALTDVKTESRYDRDYTLSKKGGTAAVGYGPLGIPPITCELPDGVDVAAGFFKFWITTEPVDLSHVPQTTPFAGIRSVDQPLRQLPPTWGTVLIPVIQRRS